MWVWRACVRVCVCVLYIYIYKVRREFDLCVSLTSASPQAVGQVPSIHPDVSWVLLHSE